MAAAYLDTIVAAHRKAAAADPRSIDDLQVRVAQLPGPRPFGDALRAAPGVGLIGEVKRRSPSKGALAPGLDPATVAEDYAAGGAAALSVLTDEEFFGGSPADLEAARAATTLPVLRKDFTISPLDVYDARLMGADALLLIVAALTDSELAALHGCGRELGLDVLVEVHDEAELDRALAVGPALVGVNQRDLTTFEIDPVRARRVAAVIPANVLKVAESGLSTADDLRAVSDAGFDAALVGESLVRARDRVAATRALVEAGREPTSEATR